MTDSLHPRPLSDIENDVKHIDDTLNTVSELRSTLRGFTTLVQQEKKKRNYVIAFTDHLNQLKRGLNRLGAEGETLKAGLTYAQTINSSQFDWDLIRRGAENDIQADDSTSQANRKSNEPGTAIKDRADHVLKQLSGVVLDRSSCETQASEANTFFNDFIEHWMKQEKPEAVDIVIEFERKEHKTIAGTECRLSILVPKTLTATLDLAHYISSDTLVIHRYEMKGAKEQKPFGQDSQHALFQKLNILADSAFQDMTVMPAREALSNILHWITSYNNLFTEPCFRCHKRLQFDSPNYKYLPPIVRTWVRRKVDYMEPDREMPLAYRKAGLAYHMQCFVAATKVASKITQQ